VCQEANFYELGGNSLNSVVTVTKLRQKGYVISESNSPDFSTGNFNGTDLRGLSFAGISEFISSKDLQQTMDRMHRIEDDEDTTAATDKQQNTTYTAHMLQEEHKDAANQ
jgi:hypothetical protein